MEVFYGVTWVAGCYQTWETHLIPEEGRYLVAPSDPEPYLHDYRAYDARYVEANFGKTREEAIEKWRKGLRKQAIFLQEQANDLLLLTHRKVK